MTTEDTRLSFEQVVAIVVTALFVLMGSACSDLHPPATVPVQIPDGDPVEIPESTEVENLTFVGFDATESGVAEQQTHLQQLATFVGPQALDEQALVTVVAINDRSATDLEELGRQNFDLATDNPGVIASDGPVAVQALIDEVVAAMSILVPSATSDPLAFLRVAGQLLEQSDGVGRIIFLSDAISTVEGCSAPILFATDEPIEDIGDLAAECMGGDFPDLTDVVVQVISGGVDNDGVLDDNVAEGSRRLLAEIVRQSGGELEWMPIALGSNS